MAGEDSIDDNPRGVGLNSKMSTSLCQMELPYLIYYATLVVVGNSEAAKGL